MEEEKIVTVSCSFIHSTMYAILVKKKIKNEWKQAWLPKKFAKIEKVNVTRVLHQSSSIKISLPEWLYKEKFNIK